MPRKKVSPKVIGPDWFLSEWMATLKLKPVDLIRETGWGKATVSDIVNGRTDYYRMIVNELAQVLRIEPHELLMHPDEAFALRRLRQDALRIAADQRPPWRDQDGNLDDQPRRAAP
jgi:hypothetical protein